MGDGAFGSNGSVHWEIRNSSTVGNGVDTLKKHPDKPGQDVRPIIGTPEHQRKFRVTARYPSDTAADAALADLNARHKPGDTELVLYVDVRPYQDAPGPSIRWEVTVDW